jgi:hypothetical protein
MAREVGVVQFRLPQRADQVPQSVMSSGPVWSSLYFGVALGTGARTHVTSSLPYLSLATVILLAEELHEAAGAGVGFGIGRSILAWMHVVSARSEGWQGEVHQISWLLRVVLMGAGALGTALWAGQAF